MTEFCDGSSTQCPSDGFLDGPIALPPGGRPLRRHRGLPGETHRTAHPIKRSRRRRCAARPRASATRPNSATGARPSVRPTSSWTADRFAAWPGNNAIRPRPARGTHPIARLT
jgi:hypothetical protein